LKVPCNFSIQCDGTLNRAGGFDKPGSVADADLGRTAQVFFLFVIFTFAQCRLAILRRKVCRQCRCRWNIRQGTEYPRGTCLGYMVATARARRHSSQEYANKKQIILASIHSRLVAGLLNAGTNNISGANAAISFWWAARTGS
jgi:hypothetical protein